MSEESKALYRELMRCNTQPGYDARAFLLRLEGHPPETVRRLLGPRPMAVCTDPEKAQARRALIAQAHHDVGGYE